MLRFQSNLYWNLSKDSFDNSAKSGSNVRTAAAASLLSDFRYLKVAASTHLHLQLLAFSSLGGAGCRWGASWTITKHLHLVENLKPGFRF